MHACCQAQQIEDFIVGLAMLRIGMMLTSHGRDGVLIIARAGPGDFPEAPETYVLFEKQCKETLRAFLETPQRSGRPLGDARRKPKVP